MLTIDATLQAIIAANKVTANANEKLIKAVNNKASRKEGKGLLSQLPVGEYVLINISPSDPSEGYEYEICTFRNAVGKEFKISLGTLLKPIFNEAGEDINECCTITIDNIGDQFSIAIDPNKFGSRPFYNFAGERVIADKTKDKFYFYSESTGDTFKGKKAVVMTIVKIA